MKIGYFDCFSGASGNMILGALLDSGLKESALRSVISGLGLADYEIQITKVRRKGLAGTLVEIRDVCGQPSFQRNLDDIMEIIDNARLDASIQISSKTIFERLAAAEAMVHSVPIGDIHFHEVGAVDAIIDVVGSVAGLAELGIRKIYCSPMNLGSGTIECAHGSFPVPAPATAELVKGRPVYSSSTVEGELLTPTGAAILTTLASEFGAIPEMAIECIGYGAGTRDRKVPNLLRLLVGEHSEVSSGFLEERVAVLQTNIDDMNPQYYDYIVGQLMEMGARDVYIVPAQMKKNRPGSLVTVICDENLTRKLADFLLTETTSIGLRWRLEHRLKAERFIREVQTRYGPVRCKIAKVGHRIVNVSPEYEDCKRIAQKSQTPLKRVTEEAMRAAEIAWDELE